MACSEVVAQINADGILDHHNADEVVRWKLAIPHTAVLLLSTPMHLARKSAVTAIAQFLTSHDCSHLYGDDHLDRHCYEINESHGRIHRSDKNRFVRHSGPLSARVVWPARYLYRS
jgi:hypothetical protein